MDHDPKQLRVFPDLLLLRHIDGLKKHAPILPYDSATRFVWWCNVDQGMGFWQCQKTYSTSVPKTAIIAIALTNFVCSFLVYFSTTNGAITEDIVLQYLEQHIANPTDASR